jgi:4-hydroxy-tetrahydrodipicolinate synthase
MNAKIFTPAVTILNNDDTIDIDGNLAVADYLIAGGVDGMVPLGSTGEFTYFSLDDKKKYLSALSKKAAGKIELLPGVGGLHYRDTVDLANHVIKLDAVRGVLVINEFYFNMSPDDFYEYYSYMAEHIHGRVYIYNYPARTGNSIDADTIVKLVKKHRNIVGLKDSVLDFDHTGEIIKKVLAVRPDFEAFSGFDDQLTDNLALGGVGGIGALSNMVPELWSAWIKANNDKDESKIAEGKRAIKSMMPFYSLESNPQKLIKEVLKKMGLPISTHCHFPYDRPLKSDSLEKALELLNLKI